MIDLFHQGCGSFDMRVLGDKEIDSIGANLRFKIVPRIRRFVPSLAIQDWYLWEFLGVQVLSKVIILHSRNGEISVGISLLSIISALPK